MFKRVSQLKEQYQGPLQLVFHFKLGVDSSGGHHIIQQAGKLLGNDKTCVASVMVALQITLEVNGQSIPLFTNPLANSARACRPLKLAYGQKEDAGKRTFFSIFSCLF